MVAVMYGGPVQILDLTSLTCSLWFGVLLKICHIISQILPNPVQSLLSLFHPNPDGTT